MNSEAMPKAQNPGCIVKKGKCQFCGKVLYLEVDAGYAFTRDPFKLMAKAACQRCADLRAKRRVLHEALQKVVADYQSERRTAASREHFFGLLERITKKYVSMVSEWNGSVNQWDREIVEQILNRPDKLGAIVAMIWKTEKKKVEQPELGVEP